jgi:hypothetical protein
MPGLLLHVSAQVQCPHGGQATIVTTNARVKVGGNFVALLNDVTTVAGCSFQVPIGTGTKPQPCMKVQWLTPATRVKVMGQFVLLQDSKGLCQSAEQIPQGPPSAMATQVRVQGK